MRRFTANLRAAGRTRPASDTMFQAIIQPTSFSAASLTVFMGVSFRVFRDRVGHSQMMLNSKPVARMPGATTATKPPMTVSIISPGPIAVDRRADTDANTH